MHATPASTPVKTVSIYIRKDLKNKNRFEFEAFINKQLTQVQIEPLLDRFEKHGFYIKKEVKRGEPVIGIGKSLSSYHEMDKLDKAVECANDFEKAGLLDTPSAKNVRDNAKEWGDEYCKAQGKCSVGMGKVKS